ncbi:MAG: hypothetical protein HY891_09555 [Deltaproteobacteria bacterium]|nr:hypothetical protein [Deltaproteobacteria bacterium]
MNDKVILSASIGFIAGLFGALLIRGCGKALLDMPNGRSSHSVPTPRGGGIGIVIGFVIVSAFIVNDFTGAAIGAGIGVLGVLEDRFGLPIGLRLALQLMGALTAVLIAGASATTALFWAVVTAGTANFYNFLDGIDGIAGLTGAVSFSLLAFFSFFIAGNASIGALSTALAAGCIGFLPLNFPRAKVFMGDAGSIFLGFEFALSTHSLADSLKSLLCLGMFLCVFYADALVTLFYRWRNGEDLASPHRGHLYQYLCNGLGYSHRTVSELYAAVQLLFGVLAILAYYRSVVWQAAVIIAFSASFIIAYRSIKGLDPLGQIY